MNGPNGGRYIPWKQPEGQEFRNLWNKISYRTMLDIARAWELWSLARQAAKNSEGFFLEVGCRAGGSGAIMIEGGLRKALLCDTFSGVPKAGPFDRFYKGGEHPSSVEEVDQTMHLAGIVPNRYDVFKGIFPDDLPPGALATKTFSLVHIDVDTYESAKGVFEWLGYGGRAGYGKCVSGCIIVFDDYGFERTNGVTKYVNEVKDGEHVRFTYNQNGQGIMVVI